MYKTFKIYATKGPGAFLWCVCRPGVYVAYFSITAWLLCDKLVVLLLDAVASRSLRPPGCDEGSQGDRRPAKLSRGKGLVAKFEDFQNNERGVFLARVSRTTSLASRETWYEAGALRLGTQPVRLRGNLRRVALTGWSLLCVQLNGITILQSHSVAKSYPNSSTCSIWALPPCWCAIAHI